MCKAMSSGKKYIKGSVKRALLKTLSYRIIILLLDFTCIYLFTGKIKVALGFMLVSNIYTSIVYFIHERIWDKILFRKSDIRIADSL